MITKDLYRLKPKPMKIIIPQTLSNSCYYCFIFMNDHQDMLILAVEQSSPRGSVALLDNSRTLAHREWTEDRLRSRRLFPAMQELFSESCRKPENITLFAAGVGPGIFSGLRISVSAVAAMARPRNTAVMGISSGEVLAAMLAEETGAKNVAVFGDARRGFLWYTIYRHGNSSPVSSSIIKCCELGNLPLENTLVASPDWDRIGAVLSSLKQHGIKISGHAHFPSAEWVGRLARQKQMSGNHGLPMTPIYLHPPV